MKKINTSHISDTAGMPIIKEHWDYLQDNTTDNNTVLASTISNYDLSGDLSPIVLYGCEITSITSTSIVVTNGAIQYNGEIYKISGGTYTKTAPQEWLLSTQTTIASPKDPLIYTDGSTYSTFENRTAIIMGGTSGSSNLGNLLSVKRVNRSFLVYTSGTSILTAGRSTQYSFSSDFITSITETNCTSSIQFNVVKKGRFVTIDITGSVTVTSPGTADVVFNLGQAFHLINKGDNINPQSYDLPVSLYSYSTNVFYPASIINGGNQNLYNLFTIYMSGVQSGGHSIRGQITYETPYIG